MVDELWTIGHWTCPESVFLRTLHAVEVDLLVDVRSQPGSRRSPQFGGEAMPHWLGEAGIGYRHVPELGGRRPRRRDVAEDRNAGWDSQSFRNYADYTLTGEFEAGLACLAALARERRVGVMCGEPMPWRCHRLLIANTLVARGWTVWHLIGDAPPRRHELGRWGATPQVAADGTVTYPRGPGGA